jgi:hypothetical protein
MKKVFFTLMILVMGGSLAMGQCTVTPASYSPTPCLYTALSPPITHTTTVATGIGTPSGLPVGVEATWSGTATTGTITISGTPSASGIFQYIIPLTGCTEKAEGTITVLPNVTPVVSIAVTGGNNPTCADQNITFTATPINGGTPSFQWKVDGGNVGTNSNTFIYTTPANGAAVTCVMTSNAPCASPTTTTSNLITVVVVPTVTPSVSIAITEGNNPTCVGQTITFTATSIYGGTMPFYQWKINGGNVGNNTNTFIYDTPVNNTAVTCVMTSDISCASPSTVTSDPIMVTVTNTVVPSVNIAITDGNNPACANQSITFTATPTNGGTTPSYQWKMNGGNVGTNSDTFTYNNPVNNTVVTCVMTSDVSCASPATATSNTITIAVNPSPVLDVIENTILCAGTIQTAINFSGVNVAAANCTWTNSHPAIGLAANGTGNIPPFTATNSTDLPITAIITVTSKSSEGCEGTTESFTITVTSVPKVTEIVGKYRQGETFPYMLIYPNPVSNTFVYQWYENNEMIPDATEQFYYPPNYGDGRKLVAGNEYKVHIAEERSPDCGNYTEVYMPLLQTVSSSSPLTISPNPASEGFTISFNRDYLRDNGDYLLCIYTSLGEKIREQKINTLDDIFITKKLPEGLYMVTLYTGEQHYTEKLLINK